jgi:hypothetical protein
MNITRGTELVKGLIRALNERAGSRAIPTSISRNVFEYTGHTNLLLYVKGRAEEPLRWGVTASVIQRLRSQPKPWAVILLFESYDRGYFLTQNDVETYICNTWPFAKDGDYKPSSGSYLSGKQPFYSIQGLMDTIETIKTV